MVIWWSIKGGLLSGPGKFHVRAYQFSHIPNYLMILKMAFHNLFDSQQALSSKFYYNFFLCQQIIHYVIYNMACGGHSVNTIKLLNWEG